MENDPKLKNRYICRVRVYGESLGENTFYDLESTTVEVLKPTEDIIYDKDNEWKIVEGAYGLANVAPTVVKMMGLTAPACWEKSII